MKRIVFILCFFGIALYSHAQSLLDKRIDFKVDRLPLELALMELSEVSGIAISFSNNILPNRTISLDLKNEKLGSILEEMLRGSSVQFKEISSQIVLFYKKREKGKFKISGFIEDAESGEKLIGANVFEKKSKKGASTNEYGFYSLTLDEGEIEIASSYLGFDTKSQKILLTKNLTVNFSLESNLTLREVIVINTEYSKTLEAIDPVSAEDIPVQQMSKLPTLAGEVDIFRMAEFMPGVQTGADGLGGLHVRGGSNDGNLVLMDGVPIYNAGHSLGIFSVFNPEAVKSMRLYKGAFPARYNGRLSSVMDVRTKEGNMKKWAGHFRAGMAASSVSLEGPIVKDKVSVFLTARRSVLDSYIENLTSNAKSNDEFYQEEFGVPLEGSSKYKFFDFNGKLNIAFSEKDRLYFSYYKGNDNFFDNDKLTSVRIENNAGDKFSYTDELIRNYDWGNEVMVLRWNHLFGNKLFLNTTLTRSKFLYDTDLSYEVRIRPLLPVESTEFFFQRKYYSELNDLGWKLDFNYSSSKNHQLEFGTNSTFHQFRPGVFSTIDKVNNNTVLDSLLNNPKQGIWEHVVYFEDQFFIGKKLKFNLGFNASAVSTENARFDFASYDTTYFSFQPRLLATLELHKDVMLQASYSKMTQPLHLLTGTDIGLPNDLWVPSTSLVRPGSSWQTTIGLNYNLKKKYNFSLEFYYKKLDHLISFQGASGLSSDIGNPSSFVLSSLDATNWELLVSRGEGESYGSEFQFQKTIGKTTGTLAYTYAFATRSFDDINNGEEQPYRFDRRHDLKMAFNHKIFKWLDFSWNWIYGTGLSTLIPVREFIIITPGGPVTLFDFERFKLLDNHRLDAGFNINVDRKGLKHNWYLGVYNIYNRRNPQYYALRSVVTSNIDPMNPEFSKRLIEGSFLPVLPSISYSLRF